MGGGPSGDTSADHADAKNDPGFAIALIVGGLLLLLVGTIVVFYLYRKKLQAPTRHVSLQDVELTNTANVKRKQSAGGSTIMEYNNPMDQEHKSQTTEGGKMVWKTHQTDEGGKYYEDTESGRTTWTSRDSSGVALTLQSSTSDSANVEATEDGKIMWKTHQTEDNTTYYEDAQSGRTTWTARDSSGVATGPRTGVKE